MHAFRRSTVLFSLAVRPTSVRPALITLAIYSQAKGIRFSRGLSTSAFTDDGAGASTSLNRSYLYVPSSSERMLAKSLQTPSDVIIYDLEDSVPPSAADKQAARERLRGFFDTTPSETLPAPTRAAVRTNALNTPFFAADIAQALRLPIRTLVLPKIHSALDLHHVSRTVAMTEPAEGGPTEVGLVASVESARAMVNLHEIAAWTSEYGPRGGRLVALLFAAEDYCADTAILRTRSRQELLYTRSQIAITAKAFGLQAIDMVCVNYKDPEYLKDECEDGRRLGFSGKQAIHPTQVDTIQATFVPSAKEILRAAKILHRMEQAHIAQRGAIGLDIEGGGKEMIDAPMIKQAENIVWIAKLAGLEIPKIE